MQLGQFVEEVFPSDPSETAGKEGSAHRAEVPLPGSPSFSLAVGTERMLSELSVQRTSRYRPQIIQLSSTRFFWFCHSENDNVQ